jgi:hypothetical protein
MNSESRVYSGKETVALAPGDIQVIVHGECFPVKKLLDFNHHEGSDEPKPSQPFTGFLEVGEWLSEHDIGEFRKLMSFPDDYPTTVFQILVNVPPERRLVCEWPHGSLPESEYYFTQLVDLDGKS